MIETSLSTLPLKRGDKIAMTVIGLIVAAVIAIPVLTWLAAITALIATILANLVYTLLVGGGLVFTILSLWENRTSIIYAWKNTARNIRRAVVRTDPIGTLTTAISRLQSRLTDIDAKTRDADAARKRHEAAIHNAEAEQANERALVDVARKSRDAAGVEDHAVAMQGWTDAIEAMKPLAEMLTEFHAKMIEARAVCQRKILQLTAKRKIESVKLDALTSGQQAAKGLMRFFGDNEDLEMIEMSLAAIEVACSEAEAEIDQVIRIATPAMEAAKRQRQADVAKALGQLKDTKLLSGEMVEAEAIVTSTPQRVPVGR